MTSNKGFNHTMIDAECQQYVYKSKDDYDVEPFNMILPPPNITGTLHLGHALNVTIQDMIARYQKLKGKNVTWIPGVDHAGIATQVVVEKQLMKEQKLTRHDLGRDKFLEKVWEWKNKNNATISNQLKTLSPMIDFSLEQFTMSEPLSNAVNDAFVSLYERKLIFRDNRMVDYCCHLKTVISGIEVEELEIEKPIKYTTPNNVKVDLGYMYDIKYMIDTNTLIQEQEQDHILDKITNNGEKYIIVSTTRPETLFGDVAIAVNPNDERFKGLNGIRLIVPFTNRIIPLIYDENAKIGMGSGAVKITPAHDPKDYACWNRCKQKYNLSEPIEVINDDGVMILDDDSILDSVKREINGKDRYICRKILLKLLTENNYLVNTHNHRTTVRICSRSKDILEPKLKSQWFMDTTEVSERSIDAVKNGELVITPDPNDIHKNTWIRFLSEGRAWCISRQLWWGHRIPAYRVIFAKSYTNTEEWIIATTYENAIIRANEKYPDLKHGEDYTLSQDDDVLDTWFSSGIYPFTVLDGKYFPIDVLETGKDILFFWVARMVMLSYALKDCLPFKKVYLHNLIRDKDGKKMSKSLGNIIDPLDIIYGISRQNMEERIRTSNLDPKEISRAIQNIKKTFPNGIDSYGVDSLRLGLVSYLRQSTDINLDVAIFKTTHAFLNKLWNVMLLYKTYMINASYMSDNHDMYDIYSELHTYIDTLEKRYLKYEYYDNYDFGQLYDNIYQYVMNHYCPFYLEMIKYIFIHKKDDQQLYTYVLNHMKYSFVRILQYIHPIVPNITCNMFNSIMNTTSHESIYDGSIIDTNVTNKDDNKDIIEKFEKLRTVIHSINSKSNTNIMDDSLTQYSDIIKFMTL